MLRKSSIQPLRIPLLTVLLSLSGVSCTVTVVNPDRLTLLVGTFNIDGNREKIGLLPTQGAEEAGRRMVSLAAGFKAATPNIVTFLGIQESRWNTSWTGPIEALSVAYQVDEPIPCPRRGIRTAAACLAGHLGAHTDTTDRGNAVIANAFWDVAETRTIFLEDESDVPYGAIRRSMRYARLRYNLQNSRFTGKTISVFSVHTVPKSGPLDQQERQVQKIVNTARELWRSGEPPPIVVGDFNCGNWNDRIRRILFDEFYEASAVDSIDMVLVGRSEKYPDEGGVILPANPRQSGRYLAKDAGLSDHNATWVMLVWSLQDPGHEVFVSYDDSQEIEIEDFGLLTDFLSRGCGPTIGIGNFPD